MKKCGYRIVLFAAAASLLFAGRADAKKFRWKLEPGQKFVFVMDQVVDQKVPNPQGGEISVTAKLTVEGDWEVTAKDDEGNVTVEQRFRRMKIDLNMPGQNIKIDSSDEKSLNSPTGKLFGSMLNQLSKLVVVRKLSDTGKVLETSTKVPEGEAPMAGGVPGLTPDQLKQMAKESLLSFPEGDVNKGDSWTDKFELSLPQVGKMNVSTKYTYAGTETVDGKELDRFNGTVSFAPEEAGENKQGGFKGSGTTVIYFDADAGRVTATTTKQNMVIEQNIFGQTITAKVNITGKSSLKVKSPGASQ